MHGHKKHEIPFDQSVLRGIQRDNKKNTKQINRLSGYDYNKFYRLKLKDAVDHPADDPNNGEIFIDNSDGALKMHYSNGTLRVVNENLAGNMSMMDDGIAHPPTTAGRARAYVHTDGNMRVKYGDGTVKVLADDSGPENVIKRDYHDVASNVAVPGATSGRTKIYGTNPTPMLHAKFPDNTTAILGFSGSTPIDTNGNVAVQGGYYAGNKAGVPAAGDIVASNHLHAGVGLYAGSTTATPGAGNVHATADVLAGGGIYAGNASGTPPTGEIQSSSHNRVGGGLYVGSTAATPTAGNIQATSHIKTGGGLYVGNVGGSTTNGQIVSTSHVKTGGGFYAGNAAGTPGNGEVVATSHVKSGGGIYAGSASGTPGAGDVVATQDVKMGGGLYVGNSGGSVSTGWAKILESANIGWGFTVGSAFFSDVPANGLIKCYRISTASGVEWNMGGYTPGLISQTGRLTVTVNGTNYYILCST